MIKRVRRDLAIFRDGEPMGLHLVKDLNQGAILEVSRIVSRLDASLSG